MNASAGRFCPRPTPSHGRLPRWGRLLVAALLLVSAPVLAAPPLPVEVQQLQTFVDTLKTLEADFVQRTENGDVGGPQESKGHFVAAKPGRFRWDYKEPYLQLIVSDGKVVWYYEPDLEQVTRTKATYLDETPAGFLASGGRVEENFTWETVKDPVLGVPGVRLTPKKESAYQEITVILDPKQNTLLGLVVVDSLGSKSRFAFSKFSLNQPVPDARFTFTPPEGVEIFEEKP